MSENENGKTIKELAEELRLKFEERIASGEIKIIEPPKETSPEYLKYQRLQICGVPPRLAKLVVSEECKKTPAIVRVEAFLAQRDPRERLTPGTLVLAGVHGTGKSVAAAWAVLHAPTIWGCPVGPRWYLANALLRDWKIPEKAEEILGTPLLIIDDLGAEYIDAGGWTRAQWDEILTERTYRELYTVITGNIDFDRFQQLYGARLFERIREGGGFFETTGASMRGGR